MWLTVLLRSPDSATLQNQLVTGLTDPVGSLMLMCAETANDSEASTALAHISIGACTTSRIAYATPASLGPSAASGNACGLTVVATVSFIISISYLVGW
jgi:hypothetical protein